MDPQVSSNTQIFGEIFKSLFFPIGLKLLWFESELAGAIRRGLGSLTKDHDKILKSFITK